MDQKRELLDKDLQSVAELVDIDASAAREKIAELVAQTPVRVESLERQVQDMNANVGEVTNQIDALALQAEQIQEIIARVERLQEATKGTLDLPWF